MKFIADVMLGRLAKRMRLLGFDVLYYRTAVDNEIIRLSLGQDRVILTRNTSLAARPLAENHLLISSNRIQEQLDQIRAAFPLKAAAAPLTRCSLCNETLIAIARREVIDLVPPTIYEKTRNFLQCPACGRNYWQGSHVKKMGLTVDNKKAGPH